MLPVNSRALRLAGGLIVRIAIAIASAFAAGCFAVVVSGLPFFTVEKLTGWKAPGLTVGLVMIVAGIVAASLAFLNAFRGMSFDAVPRRPRRSLRQRLNSIPLFRQPPWVVPDRVAEDSEEGRALKLRLVSVGYHGASYRDRETGQLWQAVYWEQGFGSGYDLVPIAGGQAHMPDRSRGDREMPWERPQTVYATPSSPLGERLFKRLDRIEADPAYPADTGSGLFRDRISGQHWRSEVIFGEQGDDGHILTPVLPPTTKNPPGKQTS